MTPDEFRSIADKVLIRELIDEYSNICTQKAWDQLGALFVEDCRWRTRGTKPRDFKGREAVVAAVTAAMEGPPFAFQMPHAPRIQLDGDRATASTLVHEIGKLDDENGAFVLAVYHDRLVRTEDGWKFEERVFQASFFQTEPMSGAIVTP